MNERRPTYNLLTRFAWMAMAICVLVLCGPVKRAIELSTHSIAISTHGETSIKDSRSFAKEKRNIPPKGALSAVGDQSGYDLALTFPSAVFLIALLPTFKKSFSHPALLAAVVGSSLPLYLQQHRLQV